MPAAPACTHPDDMPPALAEPAAAAPPRLAVPDDADGAGGADAPPAVVPSRSAWRREAAKLTPGHALSAVAMGVLAAAACWWAWADAGSLVNVRADNGHVLLAAPVVAWLAWVRRGRLPHVRVTGRPAGPLVVAAGWAMLAAGQAASVTVAYHLGALLVLAGAVMSVTGVGLFVRFAPAAFAALFALPVPGVVRDALAGPLQGATARIAAGILTGLGREVRVVGRTLLVRGDTGAGGGAGPAAWHDVTVAEACNGMPMAVGLFVVTYAFAFAWPLRNRWRWALLLASPLVMLGCNSVRTVPLVWLYAGAQARPDSSAWRAAADAAHAWSGWLMLPAAVLLLAGVVRVLKWCDLRVERYRLAGR